VHALRVQTRPSLDGDINAIDRDFLALEHGWPGACTRNAHAAMVCSGGVAQSGRLV
jgi:hypothetical protein